VLALDGALDGAELVAELGGALEFEPLGGFLHLAAEAAEDIIGAALEEEDDLLDDFVVLLFGAIGGAGGDAALDVVIEAGARVAAGDFFGTGAPGEELFGEVEGGTDGAGAGIGAEVAGAIVFDATGDGDARPGVLEVDLEVGVPLVVFEADVEEGLVALDEGGFEEETTMYSKSSTCSRRARVLGSRAWGDPK
jgi:hypothetical protein